MEHAARAARARQRIKSAAHAPMAPTASTGGKVTVPKARGSDGPSVVDRGSAVLEHGCLPPLGPCCRLGHRRGPVHIQCALCCGCGSSGELEAMTAEESPCPTKAALTKAPPGGQHDDRTEFTARAINRTSVLSRVHADLHRVTEDLRWLEEADDVQQKAHELRMLIHKRHQDALRNLGVDDS